VNITKSYEAMKVVKVGTVQEVVQVAVAGKISDIATDARS
jgi:hypothetical protein